MQKLLIRFSTKNLLQISALSALAIATKPIITPLVHIVSAPLLIPGGSLAGGFYMMWLGLGYALTQKKGTAFLIALVQACVVLLSGSFGSHGIFSIISYTLPGVMVELAILFFPNYRLLGNQVLYCVTANVIGSLLVGWVILRLSIIPLAISVTIAAISGAIGGIIAFQIYKRLVHFNIIKEFE